MRASILLECPGYDDEWSSTVDHTVELSESVWLVVIVELGVSGLSNRSYCSQWLMVSAVYLGVGVLNRKPYGGKAGSW